AEDGIRDFHVTGVQTCALPILLPGENVEDGIPIVKGGDVKPSRLVLDLLCRTTREIEASFARARLKPKDVVYSIRGTIGDAELRSEERRVGKEGRARGARGA